MRPRSARALLVAIALAGEGRGATLPPHEALRVLIVSDEVNPHGLTAGELTQPGDLSAALLDPAAGVSIDAVLEIPTNEIQRATAELARPASDPSAWDVLVYFAHRIPDDAPDGAQRQQDFATAAAAFLLRGGGVVSFHHGSYAWAGKESMIELIGAQASGAVPWDTVDGQDVIAVAPAHFVAATNVAYDGLARYSDPPRGIPDADYPYFNNVPDERYPSFVVNASAGDFTWLFASDYVDAGANHLLGFTHRQPAWEGIVVGYQPGEYQPHACDPRDPNFQVLANALAFAANALLPAEALLLVTKAPGGAVRLSWTGGGPEWGVHRAADPTTVRDVTARIARTLAPGRDDVPPPGLTFYDVASR